MVTSRQRLLSYLEEHQVVTVAEISRALRMTPANARHHLAILADEGVVVVSGERQSRGRGRPAQVFRAVRQVEINNVDRLAGACLELIFEGRQPEEVDGLLARLAGRLAGDDLPGSQAAKLTRRLVDATQRLNLLNYQARWEAHIQAPRVIFGHCPFTAVLADHPEVCRMDALLLEKLIGEPVEQTARLAQDARGARYCMFVVNRKPKPASTG